MAKKVKEPVMTLEVQFQHSGVQTFTTPIAESIKAQLEQLDIQHAVGKKVIKWFDQASKKYHADTFCCGDYWDYSMSTREVELQETEVDCCGFPITYIGDEEGAKTTISNGVVKVTKA